MTNAVQLSKLNGLGIVCPPTNAVSVSKFGGLGLLGPPQDAVSASKFGGLGLLGPPQDAVSAAKVDGLGVLGPPQDGISVAKIVGYAITISGPILEFTWPQSILVPRKFKASIIAANTSGGQAFTNSEQVIGNTPGRWRIQMGGIAITTDAQILEWETLEAGLRGRSNTVLLPLYRWRIGQTPWPTIGGVVTTSAPGYDTPVINAENVGALAIGDSTATIKMIVGGTLKPGHIFGFNEKIYQIFEITAIGNDGESPPNPTYDVSFAPPLREAIADGERLEFDNPKLRCSLVADDAMAHSGWDLWKEATPDLTFMEDLSR